MNTINANILEGIRAALAQHAPHLVTTIDELIHSGLADGPGGLPGDSSDGTLTATISWERAEPVLRALESIEHNSSEARFGGLGIYYLMSAWQRFSAPRQLPPQQ